MVEGKKEVRITGAYTLLLYSTASSQRECGMGECGGEEGEGKWEGKGQNREREDRVGGGDIGGIALEERDRNERKKEYREAVYVLVGDSEGLIHLYDIFSSIPSPCFSIISSLPVSYYLSHTPISSRSSLDTKSSLVTCLSLISPSFRPRLFFSIHS